MKSKLSRREQQVLALLGQHNKEIGLELGISNKTVENHVRSILIKLGSRTRTEAFVKGLKEGLIQL